MAGQLILISKLIHIITLRLGSPACKFCIFWFCEYRAPLILWQQIFAGGRLAHRRHTRTVQASGYCIRGCATRSFRLIRIPKAHLGRMFYFAVVRSCGEFHSLNKKHVFWAFPLSSSADQSKWSFQMHKSLGPQTKG